MSSKQYLIRFEQIPLTGLNQVRQETQLIHPHSEKLNPGFVTRAGPTLNDVKCSLIIFDHHLTTFSPIFKGNATIITFYQVFHFIFLFNLGLSSRHFPIVLPTHGRMVTAVWQQKETEDNKQKAAPRIRALSASMKLLVS